jgi:hypothetical protein
MKAHVSALVVLATSFGMDAALGAGFDGSQATITGYCCVAPTETYRQTIPLTKTVDSAVEFPEGSITNTGGLQIFGFNLDIHTDSFQTTYTDAGRTGSGSFNGYVLDFSGAPTIQNISLNPVSTFSSSQVDLTFDADTVSVSLPGVVVTVGSQLIVDIQFAAAPIPEPATYALMLAGLTLTIGMRLRKSGSPANTAE